MSIESLIYLLILVIVVLGLAYAITYALGQAGMPQMVIMGVWLIAALILLLLLLRQVGGLRLGLLEPSGSSALVLAAALF